MQWVHNIQLMYIFEYVLCLYVLDCSAPLSLTAAVADASKVHEEMQYLNIVKDIIENGVARGDRTGNEHTSTREPSYTWKLTIASWA